MSTVTPGILQALTLLNLLKHLLDLSLHIPPIRERKLGTTTHHFHFHINQIAHDLLHCTPV